MAPEIAIVGGGPAGLALAVLLEQNGIDYIVYERSAADTPPRGGCLDIHRSSGQIVLKEAGCFEEFKKYARDGDATIHWVWDHQGNKLFAFGEGRDSPEIDRNQLKRVLMSSIPEHKMRWSADIRSSSRDEKGHIVLTLADGTTASGFKLVVGADGVRSKIRHLVRFFLFLVLSETSVITKCMPLGDISRARILGHPFPGAFYSTFQRLPRYSGTNSWTRTNGGLG